MTEIQSGAEWLSRWDEGEVYDLVVKLWTEAEDDLEVMEDPDLLAFRVMRRLGYLPAEEQEAQRMLTAVLEVMAEAFPDTFGEDEDEEGEE